MKVYIYEFEVVKEIPTYITSPKSFITADPIPPESYDAKLIFKIKE